MSKDRDSKGQFTARREQRPDGFHALKAQARGDIPEDDPNYHYRLVGNEGDRVGHHKDYGYGMVKAMSGMTLMACKKEEREARERASQLKSEEFLAPYGKEGEDSLSIEKTRGLSTDDD